MLNFLTNNAFMLYNKSQSWTSWLIIQRVSIWRFDMHFSISISPPKFWRVRQDPRKRFWTLENIPRRLGEHKLTQKLHLHAISNQYRILSLDDLPHHIFNCFELQCLFMRYSALKDIVTNNQNFPLAEFLCLKKTVCKQHAPFIICCTIFNHRMLLFDNG